MKPRHIAICDTSRYDDMLVRFRSWLFVLLSLVAIVD